MDIASDADVEFENPQITAAVLGSGLSSPNWNDAAQEDRRRGPRRRAPSYATRITRRPPLPPLRGLLSRLAALFDDPEVRVPLDHFLDAWPNATRDVPGHHGEVGRV